MTQEFVTLPREVVELALEAWARGCPPDCKDGMTDSGGVHPWGEAALIECPSCQAVEALRAALDQPKNHIPDAGNMITAGWKLVPVEPNCSMVLAGERSLEQHDFLRLDSAYRAMLDAAPKPPTVKDSLTVEQPQSEQPAMTPIAQRKLDSLLAEGYTISGYSVYHERKHQHGFVTGAGLVGWWKPEGVEYPQPLGEQEPVAWLTIEVMGPRTRVDVEWGDQLQKLPSGIYKLYTNPQPKSDASGKPDEWFDRLKAAHIK